MDFILLISVGGLLLSVIILWVLYTRKCAKIKILTNKCDTLYSNLGLALTAGGVSTWIYNKKNELFINIHKENTRTTHKVSMTQYKSFVHENDTDILSEAIDNIYSKLTNKAEVKYRIRTHTDNYQWKLVHLMPTYDEYGNVEDIVGTLQDITEQMELQLKLEESQKELYLALDSGQMSAWRYSLKERTFYHIYGRAMLNGKMSRQFMEDHSHPDERLAMFNEMDAMIRDNKPRGNVKFRMNMGNGYRWYVGSLAPIYMDNGEIYGFTGTREDITEQMELLEDLKLAKQKAEESERLKMAFLANMSHEIRTPLNAIVGFADLLTNTNIEEVKNEYKDIIHLNSDLLLRLINDIIDLSKIEAGLEIISKRVDFSSLFKQLTTSLKERSTNPDVEFIIENPYPHCFADMDFPRISQIVTNFVTNAIKNTPSGKIIVGYKYNEPEQILELYVKDTGKGIPENKKHLIFQRFQKLDEFAQGTGLGLSIVRALSDKFNLECGFESTYDIGSYFWVKGKIPMDIVLQHSQNTSPVTTSNTTLPPENVKILVVEDNLSNFYLIKHTLSAYDLVHARNGQEAVNLTMNNHFDIILMDIMMPIMDGLTATKKIRTYNQDVRIIAITANAFDSDREKALEAGCNAFITKPIIRKEIEAVIGLTSRY